MKLRIEFSTALHHGSGFGIAGLVDRAVLRDQQEMPYLAGSALKGKFRYAASLVLQGEGKPVCRVQVRPQFCTRGNWCAVCRIFGSPTKSGAAIFTDAYPARDFEDGLFRSLLASSISPLLAGGSDVRASVGIDRFTRTARSQHLFSTETIRPGMQFGGEILGAGIDVEREFFKNCARVLTNFGADSARGLGFCEYSIY